jgi:Ala-tRNA(Pro) deacylase
MPAAKLKQYLDANSVRYEIVHHARAYTAQEVAASAHVSGKDLAKTVVVWVDGVLSLVVVPASAQVSLAFLKEFTGAEAVRFAHETEFGGAFPDCEWGAAHPFGNLYGLPVYVDTAIAVEEDFVFTAGKHDEILRMRYGDFERLVIPRQARFATRAQHAALR